MVVGNKPFGDDEAGDVEWTPAIGLARGLRRGLVVSVVLALLLAGPAYLAPVLVFPSFTRAVVAYGVTWLLLRTVCSAAGMVGGRCVALALALTFVVLFTQHFVWAVGGISSAAGLHSDWYFFPGHFIGQIVPVKNDLMIGWRWLHPYVIVITNAMPILVGGGFCAWQNWSD